MGTDSQSLIRQTEVIRQVEKTLRDRVNGICLNFLLLMFGPALILIGLLSLPPAWRPGLHWPAAGERAPATVGSVHLSLRHVQNDARIDNVQASVLVNLAYRDRDGTVRHAALAGPWMLQMATQVTGDAAWLYLADIAGAMGTGPIDVDMPRDIAAQLGQPHEEFPLLAKTAGNLDRPLRWAALAWLAPQQALSVRYDPRRPEVAIPEALIARESTRLQGVGILRIGAFVLGCLLVGALAWNVFAFPWPSVRVFATLLVVGTVLLWAPYLSTLVRIVMPGIDAWSGLDMDEVAADPLGPFYDEFRAGPYYASAKTAPPLQGAAWSAQDLSAHALTHWLRGIPAVPVGGSLDDAEAALMRAALASLPGLDETTLRAVGAEARALSLRRYWTGVEHYVELRDGIRSELLRRGLQDVF